MKTPDWVKQLSPDLLLHSYWENAPALPSSTMQRALDRVRAATEATRTWSRTDWLYAMLFASIGFGLVSELVSLIRQAKKIRSDDAAV